ncbi:MAG: 5-(carboxyamino)imidazole ribonucleotide mutase [Sedimentisphaerales bacterium]|nr:5-(carboxyamino)imidazole ribonucleotide mutase [Sedimentisphaerales bacterium]
MSNSQKPKIGVLMGSDSDWDIMQGCVNLLDKFGVPYEVRISSAHRTPDQTAEYARAAAENGLEVIIAAAGMAAHLAGVIAAHTILPVIGVPMASGALQGIDALLSTVQMPPGVPVATVGIGAAGAKNAAILATQILAIKDKKLTEKLMKHKADMAESVQNKNAKLQDDLDFQQTAMRIAKESQNNQTS